MSNGRGGFIGQDGLNAPDSPTGVSGSAGIGSATVSFTAPTDVGGSAITGFRVQDGTNAHGASGSSSPITVTGLTNGTAYTFNVWAINAFGYSAPSDASGSVTPVVPSVPAGRAVFGGGTGSNDETLDYVEISSTGNATDFGDVVIGGSGQDTAGGTASTTRGIWAGGYSSGARDIITYITVASAGNAQDFGDLSSANYGVYGGNNHTRSVFGGGDGSLSNKLEYVTIASTGNSATFGNLVTSHGRGAGCCSPTKGFQIAGSSRANIDIWTTATLGNATDFGDLLGNAEPQAASNETRGIVGASNSSTDIAYITMASAGNAVDFGDLLTSTRPTGGAAANSTRWVVGGGGSDQNVIQYVTIASTGNATDFGDLTVGRYYMGALSNSNGGLY